MTVCIFLGPTLPLEQARAQLEAVYLPPVRHGDVYRAAIFWQPQAIGIIDGFFHQFPAVRHKEILWAMSNGIYVFGGASMGALRAAELAPFGMIGIGRVFEAYRDGVFLPYSDEIFEDDDEVAVIHGPAETGYVSISESLVNIRSTLAQSVADGVIDEVVRNALIQIAKQTFYQDRSYPSLLDCARKQGVPVDQIDALHSWLPTGTINQKQADARAMLNRMREIDPDPMSVRYSFQHTMTWQETIASAEVGGDLDALIMDEFRRDENSYRRLRQQVINALLAVNEPIAPDESVFSTALNRSVNPDAAYRIMADGMRQCSLEAMGEQLPKALIDLHIVRHLRKSRDYECLLRRINSHEADLLSDRNQEPERAGLFYTANKR
jgi:hypothetical protein